MTTQNMFTRDFAEADAIGREQAAATQRNVELFEAMFLSLGPDCLKITGTAHDAELAEAKGRAAWRWNRCWKPRRRSNATSRISPHGQRSGHRSLVTISSAPKSSSG